MPSTAFSAWPEPSQNSLPARAGLPTARFVAGRVSRLRVTPESVPPSTRPVARSGEFLIVSALVPYKRIDLAVAAFNRARLALAVVGTGPDLKKLKKLAGPTIRFLGSLDADELREAYRKAQGLLIPGEEDFGITALEAQACGTPVIAFGKGGAVETVVPWETGLLYQDLSVSGLAGALDKFRRLEFNKSVLRSNAMKFSRPAFKEKLVSFIETAWREFRSRP